MAKGPQVEMKAESFMLVSLQEDKAKRLAQVIGNPTCTRILEHLAKGESSESKLSTDLDIPLSTVHYNLQQLVQAKLVVVEEFHYSTKGREINHYKLANKYIIIAPQEEKSGILERLKGLLPATVIMAGIGIGLWVARGMGSAAGIADDASLMMEAAPAAMKTSDVAAEEAGLMFAQAAPVDAIAPWWQTFPIEWFLIGASTALVVVLITYMISWWRMR